MAQGIGDLTSGAMVWLDALDDAPGILVQTGNTILLAYEVDNTTAADAHVQCFNAAALVDVTLGTTAPNYVIHSVANGNARQSFIIPPLFPLGLCVFSTTTSTGSSAAIQDVSIVYA